MYQLNVAEKTSSLHIAHRGITNHIRDQQNSINQMSLCYTKKKTQIQPLDQYWNSSIHSSMHLFVLAAYPSWKTTFPNPHPAPSLVKL